MKTALFLLYNTKNIQRDRAKTQKFKKKNQNHKVVKKNRLRINDKVT